MPKTPPYHVGDAVVVKPGTMCPDEPTTSLADWQGWVTDVYAPEGTLELHWDSVTMRAISDSYIRDSQIKGLLWQSMVLDIDDVLPATPRDTLAETEAEYEEITSRYGWESLTEFNSRIDETLGAVGYTGRVTDLHMWETRLERALMFPFEARVTEAEQPSPIRVGEIVKVLGISEVDDTYGLLANIRLGRRSYVWPMCDLEAIDHLSSNYQPLNSYAVWFANL